MGCVVSSAEVRKAMTNQKTHKIEVFQPRDPGQFYDSGKGEPSSEMFHEVRDLRGGFVGAEEIDHEKFGRCYNLVGTDEVDAGNDDEARNLIFDRWQNKPAGMGERESDRFREMNDQERAVSLSSGDIVRVNGTAYLCESVGWSELEEVSH